MTDVHSIQLPAGELEITVFNALSPLEQLLTFGSRQNPKRKYLFISKILGKYIPCRPESMRDSYVKLANSIQPEIESSGPVWVMGVAETATALGAGVAQELQQLSESDVFYSHTTRYRLPSDVAFSITEVHSHAPAHIVYELETHFPCEAVQSVVLVDDEVSTGNTLRQLTEALQLRLPELRNVFWVSLVNWLSPKQKQAIQAGFPQVTLHFIELLSGAYRFEDNGAFNPGLPRNTAIDISNVENRDDTGRLGLWTNNGPQARFSTPAGHLIDPGNLHQNEKYVVIGTGEFTYFPFLFAETMEKQGLDVLFQSTARSPVLPGGPIKSKQSFLDEAHGAVFYLYNLPADRKAIMLYENQAQYEGCTLHAKINALTGILN
ncbi:phosphoribosyl transferase family protein [Oleiphilus messinensis]|uniref:Phosphoribosyl transferase family protein n=1 Tax=Oleiphilus messinensis TaxID=141451 RepID=A0A1Y0I3A8_9GAMM|nr:phosphoribosyltransferase domain-containing protein [Oleiphilus messinensis]ARU54689.1 phosphoribosyl transferase family protein [Oleiphilus messinensis]